MTIAIVKERVKLRRINLTKTVLGEVDAWEAIRGMWKHKRVDAVKYQQKLRKEADHVRV